MTERPLLLLLLTLSLTASAEHTVISDAVAAFLPIRINTARTSHPSNETTETNVNAVLQPPNVTRLEALAFFDLNQCGDDDGSDNGGRVGRAGRQLAAAAEWAADKLQGKWEIGKMNSD